jgi:hypothetical protein
MLPGGCIQSTTNHDSQAVIAVEIEAWSILPLTKKKKKKKEKKKKGGEMLGKHH